ncbi:MAG TPA: glycogen synthase GlgA [bacterium]|nr:glycogen synthase GlgA [bacterium]
MAKLKVVLVVSEAVPFAKTGGLADVAGSLPKALAKVGAKPALIMPYYKEVARGGFGEKRVGRLEVPVGANKITTNVYATVIPDTDIPAFFLGYDPYFYRDGLYQERGIDYPDNAERFTLLCRGALELMLAENMHPACINVHDWQTGLIPVYIKDHYAEEFAGTGTLLTIHNTGYQGNFDKKYFPITNVSWNRFGMDDMEFFGQFSFLKAGVVHADVINTVSDRYAEEIQTPEFGFVMDGVLRQRRADLHGVLNGIDYAIWNPKKDPHITANYRAENLKGKTLCKQMLEKENGFTFENKKALVGIVSRLADQKGFDILVDGIDSILQLPCRYVLLGTGDRKYHRLFEEVAKRHPKKFSAHLVFDDAMAHRIYAGSDMVLMPSRYEPCGLGQMIAMAYGTVPVVRGTGGLADTVIDADYNKREGVGFAFGPYTGRAMVEALERALVAYGRPRRWRNIIRHGMAKDFSWERSARAYMKLYRMAKKKKIGLKKKPQR